MRVQNNIFSTVASKIWSNFPKISSTCILYRFQKLFEKFASNFEILATKNIVYTLISDIWARSSVVGTLL